MPNIFSQIKVSTLFLTHHVSLTLVNITWQRPLDLSLSMRFQGAQTFSSKLVDKRTIFTWNLVLLPTSLLQQKSTCLKVIPVLLLGSKGLSWLTHNNQFGRTFHRLWWCMNFKLIFCIIIPNNLSQFKSNCNKIPASISSC